MYIANFHLKSFSSNLRPPSISGLPPLKIFPKKPLHTYSVCVHSSTRQKNSGKKNVSSPASPTSPPSPPSPVEPAYTVKYRGEVAMGDYTNNRVSSVVKRPSDIIITVELPGVVSIGSSTQYNSQKSPGNFLPVVYWEPGNLLPVVYWVNLGPSLASSLLGNWEPYASSLVGKSRPFVGTSCQ